MQGGADNTGPFIKHVNEGMCPVSSVLYVRYAWYFLSYLAMITWSRLFRAYIKDININIDNLSMGRVRGIDCGATPVAVITTGLLVLGFCVSMDSCPSLTVLCKQSYPRQTPYKYCCTGMDATDGG